MSVISSSITADCNKYYIYTKQQLIPLAWNIYSETPCDFGLSAYVGKFLQAMEKHLKVNNFTFYITWDKLDELPSYGKNVVVIIVGDEWYRIPDYAHKVGAIFKCVGTRPILGCNPMLKPTHLNLLTLIQFLRILFVRIPGLFKYSLHRFKNGFFGVGSVTPIYDIPLGYNNSKDLPIKDIQNREYDASFSGSIVHVDYPLWSLKRWLGTPKMLARQKMLESVRKYQEKNADFKLNLEITSGYHGVCSKEKRSYPEMMMDTKICLVPRGTSFETTRLFEGMKYGCIVVTEALPQRWYLDGAPIIQIQDWDEIESILKSLLSNPELMQELHQESLNWWRKKASDVVVGQYIAEKLNALRLASLLHGLHFLSTYSVSQSQEVQ
jgi:hypothetical protein